MTTQKNYLLKLGTLLVLVLSGFVLLSATTVVANSGSDKEEWSRVFISFDGSVGAKERGLVRAFGGDIKYSYTITDAIVAKVPTQALDGLSRNPNITSIEPDTQVEAMDVELDNSWGVSHIGAGEVHTSYNNKGAGVSVGIIDSGINYFHEDLSGNYIGGYDFYYYDEDPMDVYGHGTHVAATACGADNGNGSLDPKLGVVGVAPECDLYSLRVLNEDGVGYWSDIVAAVQWATGEEVYLEAWGDTAATTTQGQKLDVVNLSLGKDGYPGQAVEDAFQNAYDQGLLIVAAAGNSGNKGGKNESTIYPAIFDSVIAVAATDSSNNRATFSSTGEDVELAAPGVDVYSAWNDDTPYYGTSVCDGTVTDLNGDGYPEGDCYKYGSGTSMASPHVAGTAALVMSGGITDHNGDGVVDNKDVRLVLQNTATDLGQTGRDVQYGHGLVNTLLAVETAGTEINASPVANAGSDQTVVDSDTNGTEEVTLDGSASSDVDGNIVSYEWHEDGVAVASGEIVNSTFSLGEHVVTLTVTDDDGATDTDNVVINVTEETSGGGGEKCPPGWQKKGLCDA